MKKIINPCICEVYGGTANGFVKIEYEDEKLSISGVIGPTRNGNCKGSCGQCTDEISTGSPTDGWTKEMLEKLCKIWKEWHLNDMRPYCEHQKELGWREKARDEVTLYHYRLTRKAMDMKKDAEKAALTALREGAVFRPTKIQVEYATLPYSITTHEELKTDERYEPEKKMFSGDKGPTERKMLGWLRPEEHPEGILCKPCPICGYKYGTSWKTEKVPEDVISWLFSLPETKMTPAWI